MPITYASNTSAVMKTMIKFIDLDGQTNSETVFIICDSFIPLNY